MTDEIHYRVLKYLAVHPEATQRDLAEALVISPGSTNDSKSRNWQRK